MGYKITDEEINKVKLNSPFALPNSPTERGMKPEAIKEMFWKPFEKLIGLINNHFGELESDIKTALNSINIYYESSFALAIGAVAFDATIKKNDIIILTETSTPDLVVFTANGQAGAGATVITQEQIDSGDIPTPRAGDRFIVANTGLGVICLESGIVEPKITVEKELCYSENPIAAFVVNEIVQTIVERVNTAERIAKGANQAVSFSAYDVMVKKLVESPNDIFIVGQNIYIADVDVPDLWVSEVREYFSNWDYTIPGLVETIVNSLKSPEEGGYGNIQVGYYVLSALETQKVNLTNYATKDDLNTLSDEFSQVLTNLHNYAMNLKGGDSVCV